MQGPRGEVQRSCAILLLIQLVAVAACSGDSATASNQPAECSPVGTGTANVFVGAFSSECVVRALPADQGQVPCRVVEATVGSCDCNAAIGRQAPNLAFADAVRSRLRGDGTCDSPSGPACSELCIREIVQLKGDQLATCQNDAGATGPAGFCYVDPAAGLGDPSLVADCPATSRRRFRLLGDSASGQSWRFVACLGTPLVDGGPL